MIRLQPDNVQLNIVAQDKTEAIRQVGQLLVAGGHIQAGYVDSMLAREAAANTYLGNGIAIPHGLPQDRDLILKTGIAVVQAPTGVTWNPGETVHLVVGIAARSDEHLDILTNLTHILDDPDTVARLAKTDDPQEIVDRLMAGAKASPASGGEDLGEFDQSATLTITGAAGLHARPATVFADLAKSFDAEVWVKQGDRNANGKRLMSLLQLGVRQGDVIQILTRGRDAEQALQALRDAVVAGLEEEEEPEEEGTTEFELPALQLDSQGIAGIAASPGIAIATLHAYQPQQLIFSDTASDPAAEAERLKQAIATAQHSLADLYQTVKARSGEGKAAIFKAHQELLDDPDLVAETLAKLPPNHSAAWAWQQVIETRAQALAALDNPVLAGRAADVRDVGQRVLAQLADRIEGQSELPDRPVILLADELTPSDTASFDTERIHGFCTAKGGATSHTAIIARSLNLPATVGAGEAILSLPVGQVGILDGNGGVLYPQPTEADLAQARQQQQQQQQQQNRDYLTRFQPAITKDGHRVEVVANIGTPQEAEQAIQSGAEGVGLLRTEFLFLNREQPPSEAEQLAALTQMTQALSGLPLIVRTLDIGGDKAVPYLNLPAEENPFLGVRGIRLCLERTDLFETQLRAILQAAQRGYLRIMFPMIATLEDIRAAKTVLESVRATLSAPPVEVGMMVEVPSAVLLAEHFAREVDFFSVGTNDLTQYLLAMDRGHPTLAKQADGLHPVVLRAIHQTVQAAQAAGKWVGVCGGIASDPLGATLLAGLGVHELSVDIPTIPRVKAKLRSLSMRKMQRLAQRALACQTAEEVRSL